VNYGCCSRAEIHLDNIYSHETHRNYSINHDKSKWRQSAAAATGAAGGGRQDKCALRIYERKRCDSISQLTKMVRNEYLRCKKTFSPKYIGRLRGSVVFV